MTGGSPESRALDDDGAAREVAGGIVSPPPPVGDAVSHAASAPQPQPDRAAGAATRIVGRSPTGSEFVGRSPTGPSSSEFAALFSDGRPPQLAAPDDGPTEGPARLRPGRSQPAEDARAQAAPQQERAETGPDQAEPVPARTEVGREPAPPPPEQTETASAPAGSRVVELAATAPTASIAKIAPVAVEPLRPDAAAAADAPASLTAPNRPEIDTARTDEVGGEGSGSQVVGEPPPAAPAVDTASIPTPPAAPPGASAAGADTTQGYVPQVFGAGNADSRVVVRALMDSWVQITGAGNELLLTRILHAGDSYHPPSRRDLVLMTGNAGALEILVDGEAVLPLGPIGAVRRDVSLDPDQLLGGTTAGPFLGEGTGQ